MKKNYLIIVLFLFCFLNSWTQNTLLVYEPFDTIISNPLMNIINNQNMVYNTMALSGFNGKNSIGLTGSWNTQSSTIPGYNITNTSPLTYGKLETLGSYAVGGCGYQGCNRQLAVTGNMAPYVTGGTIGKSGSVLWFSAILEMTTSNTGGKDQRYYCDVYFNNGQCWECNSNLAFGYFGISSNSHDSITGQRYWSVQCGNDTVRSNVKVVLNQPTLIVMRVSYSATDTVSLWVNPTNLGGTAPVPNLKTTTANSLVFTYLGYNPGYWAGQGACDEIRIGQSYASVTPVQNYIVPYVTVINSVDTAGLSVQVPVNSNTGYKVTNSSTWLKVTPAVGLYSQTTLTATIIQQNLTGSLRTDTIVLTDTAKINPSAPAKIAVRQYPKLLYTVTFTIKNGSGVVVPNARIDFNDSVLLTNSSGVAVFYALDGSYSWYDISAPNYNHTTGYQRITANTPLNLNITPLAGNSLTVFAYQINFNNDTVPVQGASINLYNNSAGLNTTAFSEADGKYTFTGLTPNPLINSELTVTDYNFGSFQELLMRIDNDTTVKAQIDVVTQPVYITVTDTTGTALQNAYVTIGSLKDTSDVSGSTLFLLPAGTYVAKVTKPGYISNTDTFTVGELEVNLTVPIDLICYSVSFKVTNAQSSPLVGAQIVFDGQTQYIDVQGKTVFNNVAPGNKIPYTISVAQYSTVDSTVTVTNSNVTQNIIMIGAVSVVTFTVVDTSNHPIDGASIVFNGDTKHTGSNGNAVFDSVPNGNGMILTVNYPGDSTKVASVSVDNANTSETIKLVPGLYSVTFHVIDSVKNPVEGATVIFNGDTLHTSSSGSVIFHNETYGLGLSYHITRYGYSTDAGTVNVIGNEVFVDTIHIVVKTYNVTFTVVDSVNKAMSGVNVIFNYQSSVTNSSGKAKFINIVPENNLQYSVSETGYVTVNSSVNVTNDSVSVKVILWKNGTIFTITFDVVDSTSKPIKGVDVIFNGLGKLTNSLGFAVFDSIMPADSVNYGASLTGYSSYSGDLISVSGNDTLNIMLTLATYNVTFNITDNLGNPLDSAIVQFNGKDQLTNSSGVTVFQNVVPDTSKMNYTVSDSTYNGKSGSTPVLGPTTVDVQLTKTTYSITFVVQDTVGLPLSEAMVVLHGRPPEYTNTRGQVTFPGLLPENNMIDSVTYSGYKLNTGTIDIVNANIIDTVTMLINVFNVEFFVYDSVTRDVLYKASVSFNGEDKTTNLQGAAVFPGFSPDETGLDYWISFTGYVSKVGSLNVANQNVTLQIYLAPILFKARVSFIVASNLTGLPVSGAKVRLGIDTVYTNAQGKASFTEDTASNVIYKITYGSCYSDINGKLSFPDSGSYAYHPTIRIKNDTVVIGLLDQNNNPLTGVPISYGKEIIKTDSIGNAIFKNVDCGITDTFKVDYYGFLDTSFTLSVINSQQYTYENPFVINLPVTVKLNEYEAAVLSIYPNPVSTTLTIDGMNDIVKVEIFNIIGSKLFTVNNTSTSLAIDCSSYRGGCYLIRLTDNAGSSKTYKFIKQ